MELNIYNPIQTIDTTTFEWKCRVRLQAAWKGLNRETKEFWGINMILIDDSDSRIHAFANAQFCDNLLKEIKEGEIYILSNFKVKEYSGDEKFRAVQNRKHIFFTSHTEFKLDENVGLPIERYAFDFFHMDDIEKVADDNRFLIDMVGKVENVQGLIKVNKNNEEITMFKFQICNGRSKVNVTFFDTFAEKVDLDFSKVDKQNLFIIISCAKPGRYEGTPHLSNYPATRVFLNPDHYSIQELKRSWCEKKDNPVPIVPVTKPTVREEQKIIRKIKEIKSLPPDFKEVFVHCEVTVRRINDKSNWYYCKCTGCDLELELENGKYKCSRPDGCSRIIPYPEKRFRVCTLCSDETGSVAIVFPDEEITRLLDKTVIDLQAECLDEKEEDNFPEILKTFIKQKYSVKIQVNEENLTKGCTVFQAVEVIQCENADNFDPNNVPLRQGNEESIVNEAEADGTITQTPNTGNSTNLKTRARTVTESLDFDTEEGPIMKKLKNIKKEKI